MIGRIPIHAGVVSVDDPMLTVDPSGVNFRRLASGAVAGNAGSSPTSALLRQRSKTTLGQEETVKKSAESSH